MSAMQMLADIYRNGKNKPINLKQAKFWADKANKN
jgi:TPR repeat protein